MEKKEGYRGAQGIEKKAEHRRTLETYRRRRVRYMVRGEIIDR